MTTSHPVIGIFGVWVCCRAQRRVGLFHSFDSVYTACETSDDSVLACHVFVRVIDRVHSPRKVLLLYSSTWFCSCRTAHPSSRNGYRFFLEQGKFACPYGFDRTCCTRHRRNSIRSWVELRPSFLHCSLCWSVDLVLLVSVSSPADKVYVTD